MTSRLNVRRMELAGSRSRRNSNDALTSSSRATWPQPRLTGKSGGHAHDVACPRGRLDVEGAIVLAGDGDLRHAATLASLHHETAGRP